MAARGEVAREVGGDSVVLPTPPFGLATTITGMQPSLCRFCGYVSGARRPRHPDDTARPAHGHSPEPIAAAGRAPPRPAEILVLVAHPELEQSRANRRLLDAARRCRRRDAAPGRRCATSTRSIPTT